jgi:hypothetical protein
MWGDEVVLNKGVWKMKTKAKKPLAEKAVATTTHAQEAKCIVAIKPVTPPAAKTKPATTSADFDKAMRCWAHLFKIPDDQRDELAQGILNYGYACSASDDWKTLREEDFNGSIMRDDVMKMFSLKSKPSAEKIKDEVRAFQQVLERLSFETRDFINSFISSSGPVIPRDFHYIRLLALQACEGAGKAKVKEGRQRPAERIKFIKSIYSDFEKTTGQEPSSSPKGCFCNLANHALNKYGMELESLSRDVQKIKQFRADMKYLGLPDWDPDFCHSA